MWSFQPLKKKAKGELAKYFMTLTQTVMELLMLYATLRFEKQLFTNISSLL